MSTISSISGQSLIPGSNPKAGQNSKDVASFGERIKEILGEVNDLQLNAGEIAEKFASGEIEDIHDVMIAAEKASVGMELVLEVRNKLIDAYREISRMQM